MSSDIWKCPKCGCYPNVNRDTCKCACGYIRGEENEHCRNNRS